MEIVKKIDQQYSGEFRLLDYHISHCQLLLRNVIYSESEESDIANFDLLFEGVEYIELQQRLEGIHILNGDEKDWEYIGKRYSRELYKDHSELYKIISQDKVFYILAGQIRIETNNLLPNETSIKTPK